MSSSNIIFRHSFMCILFGIQLIRIWFQSNVNVLSHIWVRPKQTKECCIGPRTDVIRIRNDQNNGHMAISLSSHYGDGGRLSSQKISTCFLVVVINVLPIILCDVGPNIFWKIGEPWKDLLGLTLLWLRLHTTALSSGLSIIFCISSFDLSTRLDLSHFKACKVKFSKVCMYAYLMGLSQSSGLLKRRLNS